MKYSLIIFSLCVSVLCWSKGDTTKQIKSAIETGYEATFNKDSTIRLGKPGHSGEYDNDTKTIYNKYGDRIISVWRDSEYGDDSTVYVYNDLHQFIQMDMYDIEDGKAILNLRNFYYYDKKGFNYLDSTFESDGSFYFYRKSAYDYDQNIELNLTLDVDGSMISKYVKYEDGNGNLTMTIYTSGYSNETDTTYYGTNEETREEFLLELNGQDTAWFDLSRYDENDLEVYNYSFTASDTPKKRERYFTYEFNEYGDWIRKLVFENGELTHVVERTLTYWED